MGSENLFHKKKARKATDLQRQKTERKRGLRFLIVCEGSKTEPNYLRDLIGDFGLPPHSVKIAPHQGTSPPCVVDHAVKLYDEDTIGGDSFDRVFCVFDRDTHTTFDAAVQKIRDLAMARTPKPFEAITSAPCFEYWLLLHFGFTNAPFHAVGKKSVCDAVVTALRSKPNFSNYGKGQSGIYALVRSKTATAIRAAALARASANAAGHFDPHSQFDLLIQALQTLIPTK